MAGSRKAVDIERPEATFYVPFTKAVENDDGTVTVVGKISSEAVDHDGQIVDRDLLRRLLPKWGRWGNVREMHQPKAVGKGQDYWWDEDGDPVVMAKVVDQDAVAKVRHGVLQGFSVGLHRVKVRPDRQAPHGRIYDAEDMSELSLVDRPSNPDAAIMVVKMSAAGEYVDCQTGETFKAVNPYEGDVQRGGVPDIAGDGHLVADPARAGNVQPPTGNNSNDFDAMGNPVLQPGHVRDDAASITVVAMDDRGVTVRIGQDEYVVPYTVESDGRVHFLTDETVHLPFDPKALPDDPRERLNAPGDSGKGVQAMGAAVSVEPPEDAGKAVWSTAYVNDLPDSAFAYVEPGADEDKSKRHLPYRDKDGKIDPAHVRNALARLPQTHIPEEAKAEARRKLEAAAKEVGIEVGEAATKVADIRKAAEDRTKTHGFCQKCRKSVRLGDKMGEEKGAGGWHRLYKGECGHAVRRFEAEEEPAKEDAAKANKGADTSPPSGMGAEAGSVKGDTTGNRPEGTDPAERQEDDILKRLREAVGHLGQAQEAEKEGKGGEGAENRALAEVKALVDAFTAQQQREALERTEHYEREHARAAQHPEEKAVEKAVKAAVADALRQFAPGIVKAARVESRRRLKEACKRLSSLIDEIGEDPMEEHERGVPAGAHSEGPASADGGEARKGIDPNPDASNPQRGIGQGANSRRLAPVDSGDWLERVREGIREVEELARIVAGAEEPLQEGGETRRGRLADSREVPSARRPGDQEWDFTRGDGGRAPRTRGQDADEMHKAASLTPDALKLAIAEGIRIGGEQATKAAAAAMATVVQRLERVEHMAAPPRPPVVVDRSTEFADPRAQRETDARLREGLASLPPRERNEATLDIIAAVRRRQGAPR